VLISGSFAAVNSRKPQTPNKPHDPHRITL
jgi:hypothetical protein